MKKLLLAASLTALLTSSAFAQMPYGYYGDAYGQAYGQAFGGPGGFGGSLSDSPVVFGDGRVIGADPDPNVRLQIKRDSMDSDIYQY